MGTFARLSSWSLVALAFAGCAATGSGAAHPLTARPAPTVTVTSPNGEAYRPTDAKGKVLFVDFWATWCGPCKASFPRIDGLYKQHKDKGLEVVAINEDEERSKVPEFLADTKATFPIAFDKDGKAAQAFGVQTMPSSFLIDRRGVVRFAHSGYHPEEAAQIEAEMKALLAESP